MIVPGSSNPLLLASGAGYQITNSLRFRSNNNANASRTNASAGSAQRATFSFWVKRGQIGTGQAVFGVYNIGSNYFYFGFTSANRIVVLEVVTSIQYHLETSAVFRDPSAWYHIVVAIDTTQATAANRVRIYANGTELTSFSTNSPPALNYNHTYLGANARVNYIGGNGGLGYLDAHLAKFHYVDGQQLTPASFGQTDATTGVWVPKAYTGTYGTLGSLHEFEDATTTTTIVKDTSGNSNGYASSGISVTSGVTFDQMLDTPTNNYCVLSQINKSTSSGTVKNAGLTWNSGGGGATFYLVQSTFVLSGKCYWEYVVPTTITYHVPGIMRADQSPPSSGGSYYPGASTGPANSVGYRSNDGDIYVGGSAVVAGATPSAGDIIMFAFDAATGELWVGRNGTWLNSGDPAAGTGEVTTVSLSYSWVATLCDASTQDAEINFGQRAFSYTPPSGFKALNTANLSVPTIKKPSTLMSVATYTGNGSTQSISSLAFQPDLVWIKSRSAATTTNIFDSQRGVQKSIQSTGPNAEYTDANTLTAFNSTGFSLGSDASSRGVNVNTATYVAWTWKESVEAGLDIVLYTGNGGGARNIAHGLGVAPKWMFVRGRDARVWAGWHTNLTSAAYYMDLGTAAAEFVDTTMFDSTAPDASNFRVGSYNNVNAVNYVAYLWSEVAGFSRFGSYVGNASADGPFVWCGFTPRWIIIKDRTAANLGWRIYDTVRETFNEMGGGLETASAAAESYATSVRAIDVLSNGFKIRVSASGLNGSGATFVFAAFAEAPFKYARAR